MGKTGANTKRCKTHATTQAVDASLRQKVAERLTLILNGQYPRTNDGLHPQEERHTLGELIEHELFSLVGGDGKNYRARARTLVFNLRAENCELCTRVLSEDISVGDLVSLDSENLASDAVKSQRQQIRDKHFREEV